MGIRKQSKDRQSKTYRVGSIVEAHALNDIHIGDVVCYEDTYNVVTGRLRSSEPVIQELPRGKFKDYQVDKTTPEYKFEQCRLHEKEVDFKYCGQCNQRFQCWTAGKPITEQYHFITGDFTQVQYRVYEQLITAMKKRCDDDVCKMFGVTKDVLGQD